MIFMFLLRSAAAIPYHHTQGGLKKAWLCRASLWGAIPEMWCILTIEWGVRRIAFF